MKITAFIALTSIFAFSSSADVVFQQPPAASGTTIMSAYLAPDGWNGDQFAWDRFVLSASANVTEVRWRGGMPGAGSGGTGVTDFEVSIWASIPAGSQPLVTAPLCHYLISDTGTGQPGNAYESFVGNIGGTNFYDYHFALPTPFLAVAGTPYWIQVVAWRPSYNTWGFATATGGNSSHFERVPAVTGDYRFQFGSGDCAFSLVGTPLVCTVPTVTSNPTPLAQCWFQGIQVDLTTAATGSGTLIYQWYLNNYPINDGPNGGGTGGGATISGSATSHLHIDGASYWHDVGTYTCRVTNNCGTVTSIGALVDLPFAAPSFTGHPSSVTTCNGSTATFSATISSPSSILPTITWLRDNVPLTDGTTPTGSTISGANTQSLTVSNVQPADQGSYICRVSNACGAPTSQSATLTVYCGPTCDSIDFNNDTSVFDPMDIDAFLSVYGEGPCVPASATCNDIDFNNDGSLFDPCDIDSFLLRFSEGPCTPCGT